LIPLGRLVVEAGADTVGGFNCGVVLVTLVTGAPVVVTGPLVVTVDGVSDAVLTV
jgi:hypothetical protein